MTLFDERGRIQRHETPEAILEHFYALRLSFYEKRKLHLSEQLTHAWSKLDNRMRFVLAVISGELKIANVKKADLVERLRKDGYQAFEPPSKAKKKASGGDDDDDDDETPPEVEGSSKSAAAAASAAARGYDYLLSMPLWSLTLEKVEQLRAELNAKEAELKALLATSPKQLWAKDLDAFLDGYEAWEAELAAAEASAAALTGKAAKGKAAGGKKAPAKKPAKKAFAGGRRRRRRRRRRLYGRRRLRLRREEEEEEGAAQEGRQGGRAAAAAVGELGGADRGAHDQHRGRAAAEAQGARRGGIVEGRRRPRLGRRRPRPLAHGAARDEEACGRRQGPRAAAARAAHQQLR